MCHIVLRGKPGRLTGEQLYDWTSAGGDLDRCMREHTFPHVDPEAFQAETTVKIAFEACTRQLHIEPSTDPIIRTAIIRNVASLQRRLGNVCDLCGILWDPQKQKQ
jgi:hypothetical protein